jgi:hypothetical protein
VVPPIQAALKSYLGRPVALSTVYRMLYRQGWRKLAPDKRHPKADPAARDEWKKLPENLAEVVQGPKGTGPVRLMFQDEARFGRISETQCCWCPKPFRRVFDSLNALEDHLEHALRDLENDPAHVYSITAWS